MKSVIAGCGLVLLSVALACAEEPARSSTPSKESISLAAKLIEESYAKDFKAAVTPALKRTLVLRLLTDARTEGDAANKYALLQKSRNLAAGNLDFTLVLENVRETERSFEVEFAALQEQTVQALLQSCKTPFEHYLLARYVARATKRLEALDQPDAAKTLAIQGLAAATKSREEDCILQWKRRIEDLERRTLAWEKVQSALVTLDKQPADPAANRIVGAYRCIYENDWKLGLPMLALGDADMLQQLAEQELRNDTSSAALVKLADGWFDAAKNADRSTRTALLARAADHLQGAIPKLDGIAKRKAESQLSDIRRQLSPFSTGEWIEVLDLPGLTEHVHQGTWNEVGLTLVSGGGAEILPVPAPVDQPYELRIQVQEFHKELQLYPFPHEYTTQLVINGWKGEATQLYGFKGSYDDRSTRIKGFVPAPGVTTFDIRVEAKNDKGALKLRVNGKPYFSWAGPIDALKGPTNTDIKAAGTRPNLVLVTAGTPTTFLSLRLKQDSEKEP